MPTLMIGVVAGSVVGFLAGLFCFKVKASGAVSAVRRLIVRCAWVRVRTGCLMFADGLRADAVRRAGHVLPQGVGVA
jgi:hypothetical protein